MLKILAKNTEYNGTSAGIEFNNGVALISHSELNDSAKEYFISKGYVIEDLKPITSETEVKTINKKVKK